MASLPSEDPASTNAPTTNSSPGAQGDPSDPGCSGDCSGDESSGDNPGDHPNAGGNGDPLGDKEVFPRVVMEVRLMILIRQVMEQPMGVEEGTIDDPLGADNHPLKMWPE